MGKFDLAKKSCESALNGRQRIFGKSHDSYLMSLALMSKIYGLLDKPARAKVLLSMIPESRRSEMLAATVPPWVTGSSCEPSLSLANSGSRSSEHFERGSSVGNMSFRTPGQELHLPTRSLDEGGLTTCSPYSPRSNPELTSRTNELSLAPMGRSVSDQDVQLLTDRPLRLPTSRQVEASVSSLAHIAAGSALGSYLAPPHEPSLSRKPPVHKPVVPIQSGQGFVSPTEPSKPPQLQHGNDG